MLPFIPADSGSRVKTGILFFMIASALIVPEYSAIQAQEASSIFVEDSGVLIAQKKKRKKKKKKRKKSAEGEGEEGMAPEEETGVAAPAMAEGATASEHGAQEKPGKYTWQVSLLSDFKIVNTKTGDAKGGSGNYDLDALGLYIIGNSLEVGGGLNFREQTVKFEESSNKDSSYLLKLKGVYNFGNLNTDTSVFFVGLSLGFGSTSSKQGDNDEVKGSVTQFGLGLGMHWFVDSNVAFTAEFSYDAGTQKIDGVDDPTSVTEIHLAKMGFSLFL